MFIQVYFSYSQGCFSLFHNIGLGYILLSLSLRILWVLFAILNAFSTSDEDSIFLSLN